MKIFPIVFHHEKIVSLHATKTVKNEWATVCDEFPHLRRAEIILKNNLGARGASKNVKIPSEAFNLFFFSEVMVSKIITYTYASIQSVHNSFDKTLRNFCKCPHFCLFERTDI